MAPYSPPLTSSWGCFGTGAKSAVIGDREGEIDREIEYSYTTCCESGTGTGVFVLTIHHQ